MKRFLIVTRSFFPVISPRSFRATELACELSRQGHYVKVATCFRDDFDYESYGLKHNIQFKNLGKENLKQFKNTGKPLFNFIVRALNRLLLMLIEFPDIQLLPKVVRALRGERGYDTLISVAVPYPVHWGVALADTFGIKAARIWVADCGDPYMGDEIDTFRKLFYFRYIEKWFFKKTDFITIPVSTGMKGYYPEFHAKIRVIPQGFNFNEFELPVAHIPNIPITFVYAGGFIPFKRDPRPFLDYLLKSETDFKFYIFTRKTELVSSHQKLLKGKLIVRDYVPRNELIPFIAKADFLVNFDNNTDTHSPSKLIDYAISGRPILNIRSDINEEIIEQFLNRDYSGALEILDMNSYRIENVAAGFVNLDLKQ